MATVNRNTKLAYPQPQPTANLPRWYHLQSPHPKGNREYYPGELGRKVWLYLAPNTAQILINNGWKEI